MHEPPQTIDNHTKTRNFEANVRTKSLERILGDQAETFFSQMERTLKVQPNSRTSFKPLVQRKIITLDNPKTKTKCNPAAKSTLAQSASSHQLKQRYSSVRESLRSEASFKSIPKQDWVICEKNKPPVVITPSKPEES